jgi:molybdate/tungstate transport system substrate-binding protein
VIYARSDPDADPGGYRAVLTLMLSEKLYGKPGITEKLLSKDRDYMRPKEVDLIALMESYAIDYMFIYKSVALQHDLRYVELPDETNLSDPAHAEFYETVFLDVKGNKPGSVIRVKGEYINYSMTIPFISPNREKAIDFMCFILSDEGLEVFKSNGQDPIIPFSTEHPEKIPSKLLDYLPDNKPLL